MERYRRSWTTVTRSWTLGTAAVLLGGLLAAGCNDPNTEKISMLESEKAQLASERDQILSDLQRAQDDAARAQREAQMLRNQRAPVENPPDKWKAVTGGAMTSIPGSLLFDSGKATLRQGAQAELDTIADAILANFADKDIYVFGHTDAQPIQHSEWRDNRQLSSERALAVVDHLRSKGIGPERLVAAAGGPFRPTGEGVNVQPNRRVEIYANSGMKNKRPKPPGG